jgi:iron complex transport system substrate-binding protein
VGPPRAPPRPPRRIVSVCPSNTEILCALGLQDALVGLDDCSDWPPEVQHLPRVGLDLHIDAAKVAALEPDLVVASLSVPGMEKVVAALEQRKLPVLVLDAKRLPEVWQDIRTAGAATGRAAEAAAVVEALQARVRAVQERNRLAPPLALYLEWWPRPLIVPTRDTWFNDMAAAVGGRNVFQDRQGASAKVAEEEVFAADPDHVLLCWQGTLAAKQDPAKVAARPGWERLRAVREGKVHGVEEALFGRNGPRLVEGIEALERLVRPGPERSA